jgi:HEPN domain-containing protein
MFDKLDYWLELCDDDLKAATALFESKNFLWMGFICHLIAEKALKAVVAGKTNETPPKIHNLRKLAEIGEVFNDLSAEQVNLLKNLMPLHIEARYPEYKQSIRETLTLDYCKEILTETEAFLCWIKQRLGK